jgi:murein DD-endopeptidase MepM/ murein hydrolase activator NlpD
LEKFLGNYVIIEFEGIYALFAHMGSDSIVVKEGQ